ncbi:Dabb family protein [Paenibacillus sediminis]|uniref:Heme-degrading monooxygenase HmoA n=1 Tax=Paenibacillus sediminis TaxID=664909 RepID=A0ABS4H5H7_9BACL|nr:Dabb family protein [Paenibacillus sediminis]MBP1937787.1 heme-degrading monooxygenase HmoA [Paenibacillus sediminis]
MIKHIVFFKLKDPSPEIVEKTAAVLRNMEGKISGLKQIEVGVDVVRSGRSYDIALITVFETLEDIEAYQVHPVHQEVIKHMNEVRESSVSVDYYI